MKQCTNETIEKVFAVLMMVGAIVFNLYIYRLEPTAKIDPNDNTFQFGLVDRTNTIWDFATRQCSGGFTKTLTFPVCHVSYLVDHWVHNWAQGYNLPYYYSHIPQIVIVGSYRMFGSFTRMVSYFHGFMVFSNETMNQWNNVSLFQFYHIVIYLLLSFFPLPVFLALRVIDLPWLTAGIGALLATHLSTDGLYGLDPSSFLWRGYGLSSQLFAMIWLPLAIAYSFRFFTSSAMKQWNNGTMRENVYNYVVSFITDKNVLCAVAFTVLTTAGHLGIGMISFISLGFLALSPTIQSLLLQQWNHETMKQFWNNMVKLALLAGASMVFLSYWIIPTFLHNNYHNISFWDPVWKFNSYGWQAVVGRLWNGELFDFGRAPILTYLIFIGAFAAMTAKAWSHGLMVSWSKNNEAVKHCNNNSYFPFAMLFFFWLLFYFGRTTWGGLIDLIPGMKEFHLSRFLVGLHVAGMFLAPIGIQWIAHYIHKGVATMKQWSNGAIPSPWFHGFIVALLLVIFIPPIYSQTLRYNELNDRLIIQANGNYDRVKADVDALFAKLRSLPPGRIYAGRGATFGKRFEVAETPYYMHLSTYGLPTVLWLPETWSMNSDTEQYFSDDQPKDYALYNIRYVVAPPDEKPKDFWKLIDKRPTWKLYTVDASSTIQQFNNLTLSSSYFTTGVRPAIVSTDKRSFVNVVHQWIQSDYHKQGLFPQLTFDQAYPKPTGLPNFKMIDEVTYRVPDGSLHNLFAEPPRYMVVNANNETTKQWNNVVLLGPESVETDMVFKTNVRVPNNCYECLVILKQTYHPNWKAYIDGKPVQTITTFPFFIGVPLPKEGQRPNSFEETHEVVLRYEPSKLKIALLVFEGIVAVVLIAFAWKNMCIKTPI